MFIKKEDVEFGKSKIGAWLWVLFTAIIGGLGYLAYRKKDILIKMIKREPMQ